MILEADGVRLAILAYCSVLLPGYWATDTRPGVVPLRAETYYLPYEYQPGTPAQVRTVALPDDIAGLQDDIRKAKQRADFVMVSSPLGSSLRAATVPNTSVTSPRSPPRRDATSSSGTGRTCCAGWQSSTECRACTASGIS